MTPLQTIIKDKCVNVAATAKKNGVRREAMYSVIKGDNIQIKSLKSILDMLPLTKAEREEVILAYFKDQTRKEPPNENKQSPLRPQSNPL